MSGVRGAGMRFARDALFDVRLVDYTHSPKGP
jgi:hypothetical protein